eukprot:1159521-Pelagomonas_calceolata.AAC.18
MPLPKKALPLRTHAVSMCEGDAHACKGHTTYAVLVILQADHSQWALASFSDVMQNEEEYFFPCSSRGFVGALKGYRGGCCRVSGVSHAGSLTGIFRLFVTPWHGRAFNDC